MHGWNGGEETQRVFHVHIHTCIRIPWDFGHSPLPTLHIASRDVESLLFDSVNFDLFRHTAYLFRCQVSLIGEKCDANFSNFWVSYRFINRKWGILALSFNSCFTPKYKLTYFCEKMRFFRHIPYMFWVFKTSEL